jgi:hypothetical protein
MLTRDEAYKLAKDTVEKEANELDKIVDTKIEIISKLIQENIKNLSVSVTGHQVGGFGVYNGLEVINAITKKLVTKYGYEASNNSHYYRCKGSIALDATIKISWGPKAKSIGIAEKVPYDKNSLPVQY